MIGIEQRSVCNGVNFRSIKDTKFKTARISVHFMLPIQKDKAAANALLPFLLSRASQDYPDFTKLEQRLAELYGAEINADVQKLGDVQVLSLSASCLADRYALQKEAVTGELSKLLCSIIFHPLLDHDLFPEDGFSQEKRQTLERIDSEFNDKRVYAKQRCEQVMCEGEPYGLNRYGGRDAVEALKREALTEAWKQVVETARIEIMVLGDCSPAPVLESFTDAFQNIKRDRLVDCETKTVASAGSTREISEEMPVAQGKLVMGFRTGTAVPDEAVPAAKLMTALYGGTPHSKLFLNVREKLSLCYYCSAQYNSMKGILLVQSGVETKNMDRAQEEILAQLASIQNGEFEEEELLAAKMSMCNSFRTLSDSLGGLEAWYLSQTFSRRNETPEEAAASISAVTREEIIEVSKKITLDTVYRLKGSGEDAE